VTTLARVSEAADLDGLDDDFGRVARDLERTGEELRQAVDEAAARKYEATSPDGLVRATADGRPRIAALYVSPYALRQSADQLDRLLTATMNEALTAARNGTERALLDRLPPNLRAVFEAAREYET
jgi:DNA-binding protein YbaB